MRHAMIMAGGAGTRLWPMSRQAEPKQLARVIEHGGARLSLLEIAYRRLEGLIPDERRYICTNEAHRARITADIPGLTDDRLLGEPIGRDTVNAVGFTAAVLHKRDPDAVFAVLTADHLIEPDDVFRERMDLALRLVEEDPSRLVTFSIKPTYPATGFGYVERDQPIPGTDGLAFTVERFVEKPSAEKAQAYLDAGVFGWNAGMFVWSASTLLDCLRRYKPESHAGLMEIADAWGTPEQDEVLRRVYPELPKISVDYAIMEPAAREQARTQGKGGVKLATVLLDVSWLDVGSWPAFAETLDADADGNRTTGHAILHDAKDTLVFNDEGSKPVAVLGAEGLIVVNTPSAVLVMPADRAQDLKSLHAKLPEELK